MVAVVVVDGDADALFFSCFCSFVVLL